MQPGIFSSKHILFCKKGPSKQQFRLLYLLQCYRVRYLVNLNTIAGFTTDQNLLAKVSGTPGVQPRLSIGLTYTERRRRFQVETPPI